MSKTATERSVREADYIIQMADYNMQRTGQFLFNSLRHEIADVVRTTSFDPFEKNLTLWEVADWLESHIHFDNEGKMIRLFNKGKILWEED